MWNIHATINCSFKGPKYPCASASPCQTYIQKGSKGTRRSFHTFNIVLLTIYFLYSWVDLMELQFGKQLTKTFFQVVMQIYSLLFGYTRQMRSQVFESKSADC